MRIGILWTRIDVKKLLETMSVKRQDREIRLELERLGVAISRCEETLPDILSRNGDSSRAH